MNIFTTSLSATQSAEWLCDIHTNSQIRESAQMLANCFTPEQLVDAPRTQKGTPRKHSYYNHPCSIWVRESLSNAQWLIDHAIEIENQRLMRGFNPHFVYSFLLWCNDNIKYTNITDTGLTEFAIAISENKICRSINGFDHQSRTEQYRLYIIHDKPFAKWRLGAPEWFVKN